MGEARKTRDFLPHEFYAVGCEFRIARNKRHVLLQSLRDDEAIKRIVVVSGQCAVALQMVHEDGEDVDVVGFQTRSPLG